MGHPPGGRARQLGSLNRLAVCDTALPLTTRDERVAQLSGRHTDALDVGVALHPLLNFLAALAPVTAPGGLAVTEHGRWRTQVE